MFNIADVASIIPGAASLCLQSLLKVEEQLTTLAPRHCDAQEQSVTIYFYFSGHWPTIGAAMVGGAGVARCRSGARQLAGRATQAKAVGDCRGEVCTWSEATEQLARADRVGSFQ